MSRVNLEVHVRGPEEMRVDKAILYGLSGWIIPIGDLDDTSTFDTLWDLFVPKDEAETEGGFDLDAAPDTQPEYAAGGELDWNSIFDIVEGGPKEVFRRRKLITMMSAPTGYGQIVATSSDDTYTPTDTFKTTINARMRVREASMFLLGFSSPSLDQTAAASALVVPTEKQWLQYKFLEMTLEQALVSAIGLTVSGTQEPYTEALAWIAQLLEPNIVQDTANAYSAVVYQAFCKASAEIMVPSTRGPKNLSSE